jgi:hypothetical protein
MCSCSEPTTTPRRSGSVARDDGAAAVQQRAGTVIVTVRDAGGAPTMDVADGPRPASRTQGGEALGLRGSSGRRFPVDVRTTGS